MRTRTMSLLALAWAVLAGPAQADGEFQAADAARFADLALACVHQEYPNKVAHVMSSDAEVLPPRQLTPAFFGCYDWHSAVHGHWLLVRLVRIYPGEAFVEPARQALARSLTRDNLEVEKAYLLGEGRASFERPYGLAWLLQLAAELRQWDDPQAREWAANLAPLEQAARSRLMDWLPKLAYPIRVGEHSQTAFAFGLILDWARAVGDDELARLLEHKIRAFYQADRDCPLAYEPSGQDFLSPCVAEADLLRRVLPPGEYAGWLDRFFPGLTGEETAGWLPLATVTDRSDGKLAHLDGLHLSRAWMLEGIASGLPGADPRRGVIEGAARVHRAAGLAAVTGEHYEGGHWLGSFAAYLVTRRGIEKR